MEQGSAGDKTTKAVSRSSRARAQRQQGVLSEPAGNATAAAQPENITNGQYPPAPAPPGGLAVPVMSGPESERPGRIVTPKQVRATHLAWSRFTLALCSVAILGFVVVAAFVTLWRRENIDDLTRLLEIIFAPLVAVVGVAVAFYYRGSSL